LPLKVSSSAPPTDTLYLHLGCGQHRLPGWVNCDRTPGPAVDVVFDLLGPWPFAADSVSSLYASHVLEHLQDPWAFFREAWRVLKADHALHLRLPFGGHAAAWWDLTHVRPWFAQSSAFVQPGYAAAIGNPQHDDWQTPFGIASLQLRLGQKPARLLRWYPVRKLLVPWLEHWPTAVEEIWIDLYPLKTPERQAAYQATHAANAVPLAYVAYAHHVYNQPVPTSGGLQLVVLAAGAQPGYYPL
jgi:hypothetical protein